MRSYSKIQTLVSISHSRSLQCIMSRKHMPLASLIDGSIKAARMGQIYVSKLHWSISRGVLYSYFERFGKVESVYIPYDLRTGLSRGYGFVYMQDKDHVMAALENRNQFIGQFNVLVGPRTKKPVKVNMSSPEEIVTESELTNTSTVNFGSTALDSIESSVDPPQDNVMPDLLQQDSATTVSEENVMPDLQPDSLATDSEVDPPQESSMPDLQQHSLATDSEVDPPQENSMPDLQQDSATTDSEVDSPQENFIPDLQQQDSLATDSEENSNLEEPRAN